MYHQDLGIKNNSNVHLSTFRLSSHNLNPKFQSNWRPSSIVTRSFILMEETQTGN